MNQIISKEYDRKYAANPDTHPWAVISSKIRDATDEEIDEARKLYNEQKICDHSLVVDTSAYMYDFRTCAICGKGLGTV
jgi:hypothetical protein